MLSLFSACLKMCILKYLGHEKEPKKSLKIWFAHFTAKLKLVAILKEDLITHHKRRQSLSMTHRLETAGLSD